MIGRTGRVTGRVAPGTVGEVTLQIRGGSDSFYAYASDPTAIIEKGVKVRIDDHQPPLVVFVSPVEPATTQARPARSLIQDTIWPSTPPSTSPSTSPSTPPSTPPPHHSYT